MFRIKVIGRESSFSFELGEGKHLVGSGADCAVRVERLPEKLAEMEIRAGELTLRATPGIVFERMGAPIQEGPLSAGDTLEWGGFTFFIESVQPDEQATMYLETGEAVPDAGGATVALGETALPAGVISFLAEKLNALRKAKTAEEVRDMAARFDESPPVSRAVIIAAREGLAERFGDERPPKEEEIKALFAAEPEVRTRVTESIRQTAGEGRREPGEAARDGKSDRTSTMEKIIEKEVSRSRAYAPSTDLDKTRSLLKVLENLGVVEEEIKSRALEMSKRAEGLTTAEILVDLGVLSEEDIDIKPSKQLAGTHPQLEGKVLGDYRLVKELGAGGFGVVYKGISLLDGKEYAIKVLFREYSDDITQLAIFAREAKTAKQFDHPNILKVFGLERFRDTYYMVTEFVGGGDLYDIIREKKRLDWRETARLGIPICRGLHYAAHPPGTLRGIIHRDIKPQNILLTEDGVPKIADFGLAKFEEGSAETQVYETTNAMVFKGTVSYAAPERFQGGKDIDHRSDIYSLGVMFYEMVTGKLPFRGRDVSELILSHINEKPIPPRMLNPDIPTALENIILRCLQKQPEDRYETSAEIADELERLLKQGEKSKAFSLAEAFRSIKLSGTVAIPAELPKGLPLSLRLRYFLMRPRPLFWKSLGAAAVLAVLAAAAAVFVPQALRAQKLSKASAKLAAWDYEGAKEILSGILRDNPGDEEAKRLLENAAKRLTRLEMVILPRLREEKSARDPDPEKLYQLAAEAFSLRPTNDAIARDYTEAALKAASLRIERGEFLAAAEILDSVRDKLSSLLGEKAAPLLAKLDGFEKKRDPQTLASRFENLRESVAEYERTLVEPDGVVVGGRVSREKLDAIFNAVGLIRAAYERMLEIAPKSLEALMGRNLYVRLFDALKAAIEADRSGVEARLPRLLAIMRIEPDIREKGLKALDAVYRVWKDQTPFEEIVNAADGFISTTDMAGNRLALQLCQIVLSIAPDEKRTREVVRKLTATLLQAASEGRRDAFGLARAAVETGLRYDLPGSYDRAAELMQALTDAMKSSHGSPDFASYLRHLRAICAYTGQREPHEAFVELTAHYLGLLLKRDFDTALEHLELLLSDPYLASEAESIAESLKDAVADAMPGHEEEVLRFARELVRRVERSDTPGARALKKALAPLRKLIAQLDDFTKALALLKGEPDEVKVREALAALVRLSGEGFPHPGLAAAEARCRAMLEDYDRYRRARSKRAEAFAEMEKGEYDKAAALMAEAAAGDPVAEAVRAEKSVAEMLRALAEARSALDRKDYRTALEKAEAASEIAKVSDAFEADERAVLEKAAAEAAGIRAAADEELKKAAEAERKRRTAEAIMAEGEALFEKGDFAAALKKFEEAKRVWALPAVDERIKACREAAGYKRLVEEARKAMKEGDFDAAAAALDQAAEIRNTAEVRRLLEQLRRTRAFVEAFAAGEKALGSGDYREAVRRLAIALQNAPADRKKEVKELLDRAHIGFENAQGVKALGKRDYRAARDSFMRSLAWGESALAHVGAAVALLEITNLPDVREDELINPDTNRSRMEDALAHIAAFRRIYDSLDEKERRSLERWRRTADRYEALSLYYKYVALHDPRFLKRALSLIDGLVASSPENVSYLIDKAAILSGLRRFKECVDLLLSALEKEPDNALIHRHLGAAMMALGKLDEAESEFKKAAEMNPSDAYAWLGLGNIYTAREEYERAEEVISKAVAVAPNLPEANNNMAWLYATAKDPAYRKPKLAMKYALRANELTGYSNPDWLDTLAHAYAAGGNYRMAVETEKKALELSPDREDLKETLERFRRQAEGR